MNEEIRGVTLKEPTYCILNTKVDQLRRHTQAHLKSIFQIPIIYQITRSQAYQRRTQPYGDDETLTSKIGDPIIDTIYDTHQPIFVIVHSKTSKDPKIQKLLDFLEGDSTLFDFLETQAGGSRPLEPHETNPPLASIPSPRPNFNYGGNMASNQP